jgi:hypothetical protein
VRAEKMASSGQPLPITNHQMMELLLEAFRLRKEEAEDRKSS